MTIIWQKVLAIFPYFSVKPQHQLHLSHFLQISDSLSGYNLAICLGIAPLKGKDKSMNAKTCICNQGPLYVIFSAVLLNFSIPVAALPTKIDNAKGIMPKQLCEGAQLIASKCTVRDRTTKNSPPVANAVLVGSNSFELPGVGLSNEATALVFNQF